MNEANGPCRALVLGVHSRTSNPIFSEYEKEIRRRCEFSEYVNYRDTHLRVGAQHFEQYVRSLVREQRVNHIFVIFAGWDYLLRLEFLLDLSRIAKIVLFNFDTEYYFENLDRYYGQVADLVVLTDVISRGGYEELSIPAFTSYSLYDAQDRYPKLGGVAKSIDVSFIGNLAVGDRREHVEFLQASGVQVRAFGMGTEGGVVSQSEVVEIHNRSKICLNFTGTQDFSNMPPGIPRIRKRIRQAKGRPIEVALCGSFLLSQFAPGISSMFEIGRHCDVFESKEEMLEKVNYYLTHDEKREGMAALAHRFALENYDIRPGFDKIFAAIEQARRRSDDLFVDKPFLAEHALAHFEVALHHFARGRLAIGWEELAIARRCRALSLVRLLERVKLYTRHKARRRVRS